MSTSDSERRRVVVVAGPTAAGKSLLALDLGAVLPVTIVCADARQAIRGMQIGTAAPSDDDLARIPHVGFAVRSPEDDYSAANFALATRAAIASIPADRLPLVVGGSGLYIQALIDGFSADVVPTTVEVRQHVQQLLDKLGRTGSYELLERVDPLAAKRYTDMNPRRIQRALEYFYATGSALSTTWSSPRNESHYLTTFIAVDQDNDALRSRIALRCDHMWSAGLLDETQALLDRGIDPTSHIMRTIGYAEAVRVLTGGVTLEEAKALLLKSTWQYAKRQRTWFRRDARYTWMSGTPDVLLKRALDRICSDDPTWCS